MTGNRLAAVLGAAVLAVDAAPCPHSNVFGWQAIVASGAGTASLG